MSDAVQILESSVNAATVYVLPLVPTFCVTGVVVLGVIIIEPVDVAQVYRTVSTNVVDAELAPF